MSAAAPASDPSRGADRVVALILAAAAAMWHALLMTRATNDNFLHLTLAQQWLHGDWPVRDFFDQGWVLQYTLSAAAMLAFGERLGAEALIVGVSWAITTYLIFLLVRRLTGSTMVAIASALLPIVASARGYSYPKGIVYAVAAVLWWRYVDAPSTRRASWFGIWAALAFYWRPDHGIYVAIGIALATVAAHGLSALALKRCAVAALTMVACLMPFFIYVQAVYGLVPYARTGIVAAEVEHESQGTHEWPVLRYASSLMTVASAEPYAPVIGLRWRRDSTIEQRQAVLASYRITGLETDPDGVQRVRLSADAVAQLRALINEPLIDDTAGIDRGAGTITDKAWPASARRNFKYALLRLQVLPALDAQARGSEFTAALFFAAPLALLLGAPWIARGLASPGSSRGTTSLRPAMSLAAFGAFALLVAWAMIRNPFPARVADAVALSSVAFGCCLGGIWHAKAGVARTTVRAGAVLLAAIVVWVVAASGRFESPLTWFQGAGVTYDELTATPPLAHYVDRPARFTLRLAAYVRECVPPEDRLVVLWFEPEIYYFSDRMMALRHPVFAPAWSALDVEQRATLDKVDRFKPPIVLARQPALDEYARATYPGVMNYVEKHYDLEATVPDAGEKYLIYARRERRVTRSFGAQGWPCYTTQPSHWTGVGSTD